MVRLAENLKKGGSPYLSETNANGGCVVRENNDEIVTLCGVVASYPHFVRSDHCRSGDFVDDYSIDTVSRAIARSLELPKTARDSFNQCAGARHYR
jgi:hypothetical protein